MNSLSVYVELPWLYAGLMAYAMAFFFSFKDVFWTQKGLVRRHYQGGSENFVLLLLLVGVLLLAMGLAVRWERIGHGPFVNLFELLMSQLFSLGLIYALVYWRYQNIRSSAVVVLPLIGILGIWILLLDPVGSPFPPTYHNNWLWAHVGFGKVFLSFCLVGSGLAGVILLRTFRSFELWFSHMPNSERIDLMAWRFMLVAFIFHSLMLLAGAVWAQDAWGRYWQWDALETSSFLNWLMLGASLHVRLTYKIPIKVSSALVLIIFAFAFFTYFGAPFYSEAAHKGVI